MPHVAARNLATLALAVCIGCGAATQPSSTTDSAVGDTASETLPAGCPPTMPAAGPCALPNGTVCEYDASHEQCGKATCSAGTWQVPFGGMLGCKPPPGPNPCTPTLDKSCAIDADCVFSIHQTNCCGDTLAVGYKKSDAPIFSAAEAICRRTYPGCGCPSQGLATDEGRPETGFLTPEKVQVKCVGGMCRTSPKP